MSASLCRLRRRGGQARARWAIVDGIPQSLFATQILFRCLQADVPEQELYLFEFLLGGKVARALDVPC